MSKNSQTYGLDSISSLHLENVKTNSADLIWEYVNDSQNNYSNKFN